MRYLTCLALVACVLPASLAATPRPEKLLSTLPAWFEPSPDGKAFVSRGAEGSLWWSGGEAVLRFAGSPAGGTATLRWRLLGAVETAPVEGEQRLGSRTNYLLGNRREAWRTGVAHYARARAREIYPGVDVVWYANGRMLEYDFVVAPGADPSRIGFRLEGGSRLRLTAGGDLVVETGGVTVRQHKPVVYQDFDGRRVNVRAEYKLARNGDVRFALGRYDRSRSLVIDPVFGYAGFLGGTRLEVANSVAIDAEGGLWITGTAQSAIELPEEMTPYQREKSARSDAFLARIIEAEGGGGRLDYWTYIGGNGDDEAAAMVMDHDGVLYVTGSTSSLDFPPAGNAYRIDNPQNDVEAFLIRFDPRIGDEFALTYSSYFGGPGREYPQAIAVSPEGLVAIAGHSTSGELPEAERTALQPSNRGGVDVFFVLFDPQAASAPDTVRIASFLGGDSTDIANAVAFDSEGRIVLAGISMSSDFPVTGPSYMAERASGADLFIAVVDPRQTGLDQLVYGTYFGGSALEAVTAAKFDAEGRFWMTGYTMSPDFPVTPGAYQLSREGPVDAFLLAVDLTKFGAEFVVYSTYFGGNGAEVPYGLALEPGGLATIAGYSTSWIFPAKEAPVTQPERIRLTEAFFASFDTTQPGAAALRYAAQYGGRGTDVATWVDVDAAGNVAIAGFTSSDDLPTASPTGKSNDPGLYTGWFLKLAAPQP